MPLLPWPCHAAVVSPFSLSVRVKRYMSMKSHVLTAATDGALCHDPQLSPPCAVLTSPSSHVFFHMSEFHISIQDPSGVHAGKGVSFGSSSASFGTQMARFPNRKRLVKKTTLSPLSSFCVCQKQQGLFLDSALSH